MRYPVSNLYSVVVLRTYGKTIVLDPIFEQLFGLSVVQDHDPLYLDQYMTKEDIALYVADVLVMEGIEVTMWDNNWVISYKGGVLA